MYCNLRYVDVFYCYVDVRCKERRRSGMRKQKERALALPHSFSSLCLETTTKMQSSEEKNKNIKERREKRVCEWEKRKERGIKQQHKRNKQEASRKLSSVESYF